MRFLPLVPWLLVGCADTNWKHTAPHNFPPAHEWNAPLETSWINAVDTYRRFTAPPGTIYDPLMRTHQPDFGKLLREEVKQHERQSQTDETRQSSFDQEAPLDARQ
jgi:hypothetical protein